VLLLLDVVAVEVSGLGADNRSLKNSDFFRLLKAAEERKDGRVTRDARKRVVRVDTL